MVGVFALLSCAVLPSMAISPCDLPTSARGFDMIRYCRVIDSHEFNCDSSVYASTVAELWPAVRSAIHAYPAVFFDVDDRPMIALSWSSTFDIPQTKTKFDETYWCADSLQVDVTGAHPDIDRHLDYYTHILHKRWFETVCGRQLLIIVINDVTNSEISYPKVILSPGSSLQEFFNGFEQLQKDIDDSLRMGARVETVLVRIIQTVGLKVTERIKDQKMNRKPKHYDYVMGIPSWGWYSFGLCFCSVALLMLAEYVVIRRNALGASCMSTPPTTGGTNKPKSTNMMLSSYKDRAASSKVLNHVVFVPSTSAKASSSSNLL